MLIVVCLVVKLAIYSMLSLSLSLFSFVIFLVSPPCLGYFVLDDIHTIGVWSTCGVNWVLHGK